MRDSGDGGVKHKYIEHLIKELGEERGFRATIEESIHDGARELSFTHVVMMASHAKHLKGLSMHIGRALEDEETGVIFVARELSGIHRRIPDGRRLHRDEVVPLW